MESKEKLETLYNLKIAIESKGFQEFIMKPLYEEMDKLKNAYDCESLRELSALKGKRQGLKFIIGILKQVDTDTKNLKYELESRQE